MCSALSINIKEFFFLSFILSKILLSLENIIKNCLKDIRKSGNHGLEILFLIDNKSLFIYYFDLLTVVQSYSSFTSFIFNL